MIFSVFQFFLVFGYSWSALLWYRCYYPHRSRDALFPVCGILIVPFPKNFWNIPIFALNCTLQDTGNSITLSVISVYSAVYCAVQQTVSSSALCTIANSKVQCTVHCTRLYTVQQFALQYIVHCTDREVELQKLIKKYPGDSGGWRHSGDTIHLTHHYVHTTLYSVISYRAQAQL